MVGWFVQDNSEGSLRSSLAKAIRICHPPENSFVSRSRLTLQSQTHQSLLDFDFILAVLVSFQFLFPGSNLIEKIVVFSELVSISSIFSSASSIFFCSSNTSSKAVDTSSYRDFL